MPVGLNPPNRRTEHPHCRPRFGFRSVVALAAAVALFATAVLTLVAAPPASAANGDITTVAGNGSSSPTIADGSLATSGAFNQPDGVAFDGGQNMIVVEYAGGRVRRVAPNGVVSTIASGGLTHPTDAIVDPSGAVIVADYGGHRVRRYSGGSMTVIAGSGVAGYGGDGGPATSAKLDYPAGLALAADGSLYIADSGNNRIRVVRPDGKIDTFSGKGPAGYAGDGRKANEGIYDNPTGLTFDASGNLYIADTNNNRIRKIDTGFNLSTVAGNGTFGWLGDGGAATSARIGWPVGLTFDSMGSLFFAEDGSDVVRKVAPNGTISTVAGTGTAGYSGDGGPATSALLHDPVRVAFDAAGNLVIGDRTNNRVRRLELNTPAAPAITGLAPASPSPSTTVSVSGTAPAGVTVFVYKNATCSGSPAVSAPAATFSTTGVAVSVAADSTTQLSANDQGTGNRSGCSSSVSYTSDGTAPAAPVITSQPPAQGTGGSPYWTFTAEAGSTTTCWLTDGAATVAAEAACSASATYTVSSAAVYTFHVRARDAAGNVGPEAQSTYELVTSGPAITAVPVTPGVRRSVAWTFNSVDSAPQCRLSRGGTIVFADAPCTAGTPVTYDLTGLPDGAYTFTVTETGAGGIASTSNYVLDTTAPAITSGPAPVGAGTSPSWSFSGGTGARTVCSLSGPAPTVTRDPCSSGTFSLARMPDGTYTFSVWSADGADVSATSTATYELLTTVPPAASVTGPASPGNDTRPTWSFTVPAEMTATCSLVQGSTTIQPFSGCSGLETYDLGALGDTDGTYTLTVVLTNAAGTPGPPASADYVLDRVAPAAPTITDAPPTPANTLVVSWSFTAEPGSATRCSLAGGGFTGLPAPCTSPVMYDLSGQPDGAFTFSVDATDAAGNLGAAATSTYVLDTSRPDLPTFTRLPVDPGNSRSPSWAFSAPVAASTRCALSAGGTVIDGPLPCAGTYTAYLLGRPDGAYALSVVAVDTAGNESAAATSTYTLDTAAPATPTFTRLPLATGNGRTVSWSFSAPGADTASCTLTSGTTTVAGPVPCSGTYTADLTDQPDGDYTLSVVAADAAGNVSPPATTTYRLDTTAPPAPVVVSGPPDTGTTADPTWTFDLDAGSTATCSLQRGDVVLSAPAPCTSPVSYDLAGQGPGAYTVTVTATDEAGNTGPATVLVYTLVPADTNQDVPPAPAPPAPAPTTTTTTTSTTTTTEPPPAPAEKPAAEVPVPVVSTTTTTTSTTLAPAPPPAARPAPAPTPVGPSVAAQIAQVAKAVGEKTAFPSGLAVLVVLFLAVQDRIDRSDPKLALAPVHAEPDLGFDSPFTSGEPE